METITKKQQPVLHEQLSFLAKALGKEREFHKRIVVNGHCAIACGGVRLHHVVLDGLSNGHWIVIKSNKSEIILEKVDPCWYPSVKEIFRNRQGDAMDVAVDDLTTIAHMVYRALPDAKATVDIKFLADIVQADTIMRLYVSDDPGAPIIFSAAGRTAFIMRKRMP
jgi:hypothetical protein